MNATNTQPRTSFHRILLSPAPLERFAPERNNKRQTCRVEAACATSCATSCATPAHHRRKGIHGALNLAGKRLTPRICGGSAGGRLPKRDWKAAAPSADTSYIWTYPPRL